MPAIWKVDGDPRQIWGALADPERFDDAPCTMPGAADPCSDDPEERAYAVRVCRLMCPAATRLACKEVGDADRALYHVWAGVDRHPSTRRSRS